VNRIATCVVLCAAALCRGDECPWLNAATAAGVLGDAVQTKTGKARSSCDFSLLRSHRDRVRIQVTLLGDAATWRARSALTCPASEQRDLRAMGNEAAACTSNQRGRLISEVAGRVRNQAFRITIEMRDNGMTSDRVAEKARFVAEQVSGNLF
jgi:hypothetical protein